MDIYISFRVDINSTESLFGTNTQINSTVSGLQKYCECYMEPTGSFNSISDYNAADCSIAPEMLLCSKKTTTESFTSTCEQNQNRNKRDANEMYFEHHIERRSIESDDTIASQPLTIDPNFDLNFVPPVIL